jgi:hypothetical protein
MSSIIQRFSKGHEQLKHRIHSYWRQNTYLAPRTVAGKIFMSCVYFSVPVAIGYYVSTKAVEISESTIDERFGKNDAGGSEDSYNTTANTSTWSQQEQEENNKLLGVVGVHMVTNDKDTQEINRINLERFLKKQRKLKIKREREQAAEAAAKAEETT